MTLTHAWRLASNLEFLAAKIEEMGLVPTTEAEKEKRRSGSGKGSLEENDDTDWLDELETAAVGQRAADRVLLPGRSRP
jgi:hypothetical protein